MSVSFDKVDVRRHLRDLGYRDVGEQQLDEFVRDLKRLMRHEERRAGKRRAIVTDGHGSSRARSESPADLSSSAYGSSDSIAERDEADASPKKKATASSGVVRKVARITTSSRQQQHGHRAAARTSSSRRRSLSCSSASSASTSASTDVLIRVAATSAGRDEADLPPVWGPPPNRFSSARPTTSFIRPARGATGGSVKCDPVRLHQYYQRVWSRTRFPGDDDPSTKGMRWAVREWMMGEPEK